MCNSKLKLKIGLRKLEKLSIRVIKKIFYNKKNRMFNVFEQFSIIIVILLVLIIPKQKINKMYFEKKYLNTLSYILNIQIKILIQNRIRHYTTRLISNLEILFKLPFIRNWSLKIRI